MHLEEVNVIEADIGTFGSDGYSQDSEYHYEKVEGDNINLERRIDLHYEAAEQLVLAVRERARSDHGDELEDFDQKTTYDELE